MNQSNPTVFSTTLAPLLGQPWIVRILFGARVTKGSFDTLKKVSSRLGEKKDSEGVFQLFPSRCIASLDHMVWVSVGAAKAFFSGGMRFNKLDVELLGRLAGTFHFEKAVEEAGLLSSDRHVVLVYVGPVKDCSLSFFEKTADDLGIISSSFPEKETLGKDGLLMMERSALSELSG